jgi:alpha-mannosidase
VADGTVRFAPALADCLSTPHSAGSPFKLVNAPNVQLETIKRAEDDDHSSGKATIIIRLFEQLGGHAKPVLKM